MIQIYNEIGKINEYLTSIKEKGLIIDYRIYLKLNNTIGIYIIGEENELVEFRTKYSNKNTEIEVFTEEEVDDFLRELYFESDEKINTLDSDRRLVSLLDESRISKKPEETDTPIITFYSYKGGVGRSTTLASCASYLAMHYSKKVVVIDCDFEAPGFTNFFLNDPGIPFYSNGVIEYLLDAEFCETKVNVRNYLWEASKEYSGKGEIFVMPAGNLSDIQFSDSDVNDRMHYLKGLARIDFSEKKVIVHKFLAMINEIKSEINPDVILMDSRTGFNDIFGLTAFQLSNIVVGFFGNNVQSLPGIHFFIDSILKRNYLVGLLVNSVIPASNRRRWFNNFKENVETYISHKSSSLSNNKDEEVNTDEAVIEMFPVTRHEILEGLGTKEDDILDFVDLIANKTFTDYSDLFEKISSLLQDFEGKENVSSSDNFLESSGGEEEVESVDINLEEQNNFSTQMLENDTYNTKMKVLTTLQEKMPELYAEDIEDFENEYQDGRYFYRNCMLDIFNLDKFIVLGNKGTGKTYIYRSLKNKNIVNQLKQRANKAHTDYQFIHLILKDKYFIDTTKFDGKEIFSKEKYYERFWLVYIWNVLYTELGSELGLISKLETFQINDNTITSNKFHEIISSDESMVEVEHELDTIDFLLKEKDEKHVMIIFDELDFVVKPHMWSERVAPLINLCKRFTYQRIYPKMFLRSDLFEKISNVNNIQALNNRSINIEWNREELFAYFFKLILSHSKDDFYNLMRQYKDYPNNHIAKIRRDIDAHGKQPQTDEYILKHLTSTFFGKYADIHNTPKYGESYDWFFRNLKNANGTISLRPFIDLLDEAVKWAISDDKTEKPILPQYYYTHGQARGKAVENHFNDLAREQGNGDLIYIFQYIRDDADTKFKMLELQQKDFYELLDLILTKYGQKLDNKTKEGLIELLKVNGILVDRFQRNGHSSVQKRYQFALLYKYYLGLKSRSKYSR